MQNPLKIALIIVLLVYIFIILKSVKRKNMRIGYLVFWSITAVVLIIALLIPNLVESISNFLGFGVPVNMIFSAAIFIILYLIFHLTVLISKEQKRNVQLIQEVSMLKKRVQELEEKGKDENDERV